MNHSKEHEEFKKFLKRGKHRITPERFEVLDHAFEYKGHFAADELFVRMKSRDSNVSRATVYNTLELLASCDLLTKRNFGENKTFYEATFGKVSHDHLICMNCGAIKEFSSPKVAKLVEEISAELEFSSTGYSFNIFGICNSKECKYKKHG